MIFTKIRKKLFPIERFELKKLMPLFFMKFFISFNYGILTCMKDTFVVTAKGSGAEVIPILKGWIVLPVALLVTLVYSKLSNHFSITDNLELQLTAVYYAPRNIPQGEQLSRYSVDFGLTQKIFEGKGEISFSASDIFNTFGIRQTIEGDGFNATYENYYETQIFRLGLKYRF